MRVGERGQVTIPKHIRERLGLLPNTEVDFILTDEGVLLTPGKAGRRQRVRDLYGRKRFDRSTDELMKLLRG